MIAPVKTLLKVLLLLLAGAVTPAAATAATVSTALPAPSLALGCSPLGLDGAGSFGSRLPEGAADAGVVEPNVEEAYQRALEDGAGIGPVTRRARAGGPVQVPVYIHVIQDSDAVGVVPAQQITDQMDVLNDSFDGSTGGDATGISFTLIDTDVTVRPEWYPLSKDSPEEVAMKSALREGGARALNVYLVEINDGILGWATFPDEYAFAPAMDGVVVESASVPGGTLASYNLGDTATHEIGHWLGLFHTFSGGCSSTGDFVADTPAEMNPHYGACAVVDSCVLDPGNDPVENFMDYSDDACMHEFTAGQGNRMHDSTAQYRNGAPVAAVGAATTKRGNPVAIAIDASDPDGDGLSYTVIDPPDHGSVSGTAPALIYTPDPRYAGLDSFAIQVTDVYGAADAAAVSLNVTDRKVSLRAKAKRKQKLSQLAVSGSCGDEACDLSVKARIAARPPRGVKGGAERFALEAASGRAKANKSGEVRLRLSQPKARRLSALLDEGWKAKVKASITATDAAGNKTRQKASISVKS